MSKGDTHEIYVSEELAKLRAEHIAEAMKMGDEFTAKVLAKVDRALDKFRAWTDIPEWYKGEECKMTRLGHGHTGLAFAYKDGTWSAMIGHMQWNRYPWRLTENAWGQLDLIAGRFTHRITDYIYALLRLGKITEKEANAWLAWFGKKQAAHRKARDLQRLEQLAESFGYEIKKKA